jgi:hypothetical protein
LQAVAGAFDVEVVTLRSVVRVPESQLVRMEWLTSYEQFVTSEETYESDVFTRPVMLPPHDELRVQASDLWGNIFVDRDVIEPCDSGLWEAYIQNIRG